MRTRTIVGAVVGAIVATAVLIGCTSGVPQSHTTMHEMEKHMAINPGNPAYSLPPAEDDIIRELRDLARRQMENAAARSLEASSVHGMEISTATFRSDFETEVGFGLTSSINTRAGISFTVPDGYTRAMVSGSSNLNVLNTTGAQRTFMLGLFITPYYRPQVRETVANNAFSSLSTAETRLVEDLAPGDVVEVNARVSSSDGISASGSNAVNVTATVIFLP